MAPARAAGVTRHKAQKQQQQGSAWQKDQWSPALETGPAQKPPPTSRWRRLQARFALVCDHLQREVEDWQAQAVVLAHENSRLRQRLAAVEALMAASNKHEGAERAVQQAKLRGPFLSRLPVLRVPQLPLAREDGVMEMCTDMGIPEFRMFLQHAVCELSGPMICCCPPVSDVAAAARLQQVYHDSGVVFRAHHFARSEDKKMIMSLNLRTGVLRPPSREHWQRVAQVVQLTPKQVLKLSGAMAFVESRIRRIQGQRRQLLNVLLRYEGGYSDAWGNAILGLAECAEAVERLEQQEENEWKLRGLLTIFLFLQLDALQFARMTMASYPYHVNYCEVAAQLMADAAPVARAEKPDFSNSSYCLSTSTCQ